MVDYTFFSMYKYFNTLSNIGYVKQKSVDKLLLLVLIQEVIDNDFRGLINERDYNDIVQALYCLYGSDCLMPYPDYYNNKNRRVMYTGSISELSHRVEELEKFREDFDGLEVLIPGEDDWNEVVDDGLGQPIAEPDEDPIDYSNGI